MVILKQNAQTLNKLKDEDGNEVMYFEEISQLAIWYFQGLFGSKNPEIKPAMNCFKRNCCLKLLTR